MVDREFIQKEIEKIGEVNKSQEIAFHESNGVVKYLTSLLSLMEEVRSEELAKQRAEGKTKTKVTTKKSKAS